MSYVTKTMTLLCGLFILTLGSSLWGSQRAQTPRIEIIQNAFQSSIQKFHYTLHNVSKVNNDSTVVKVTGIDDISTTLLDACRLSLKYDDIKQFIFLINKTNSAKWQDIEFATVHLATNILCKSVEQMFTQYRHLTLVEMAQFTSYINKITQYMESDKGLFIKPHHEITKPHEVIIPKKTNPYLEKGAMFAVIIGTSLITGLYCIGKAIAENG